MNVPTHASGRTATSLRLGRTNLSFRAGSSCLRAATTPDSGEYRRRQAVGESVRLSRRELHRSERSIESERLCDADKNLPQGSERKPILSAVAPPRGRQGLGEILCRTPSGSNRTDQHLRFDCPEKRIAKFAHGNSHCKPTDHTDRDWIAVQFGASGFRIRIFDLAFVSSFGFRASDFRRAGAQI